MKKFIVTLCVAGVATVASAQEAGKNLLLEFLDINKTVQAEFIQVEPDPSMQTYGKIINAARDKDPEWFAEHQSSSDAGTPLPYHEKLMTKKEYEGYLKSWDKRKIVPVKGKNGKPARFEVRLTEESNGNFVINIPEVPICLLQYSPKKNTFKCMMLGEAQFLEKVDAPANSSLRAWTGYEWKGVTKGTFENTKLNFAIGRTGDGKYGYIIYRIQQYSDDEGGISDKRYVLRFAPVKKAKK